MPRGGLTSRHLADHLEPGELVGGALLGGRLPTGARAAAGRRRVGAVGAADPLHATERPALPVRALTKRQRSDTRQLQTAITSGFSSPLGDHCSGTPGTEQSRENRLRGGGNYPPPPARVKITSVQFTNLFSLSTYSIKLNILFVYTTQSAY